MAATLKQINTIGNFYCLFSDGTHLFCYYDKTGYKSLYYLRRVSPFAEPPMLDEEEDTPLKGGKDLNQFGYIVASAPLTNEKGWIRFNPGELLVFCNGAIEFSSE